MIVLKDSVTIKTTPAEVFNWFEHLDEHYLAWHPSHVSCRYLKKHTLETGAVLCIEETLHGKLHKLHFHITGVIPHQGFTYRVKPGVRGGFLFLEHELENEEGVDVEAKILIGCNIPLVCHFVDLVLQLFFSSRIKDLKQHMKEEGINLRNLLEQK